MIWYLVYFSLLTICFFSILIYRKKLLPYSNYILILLVSAIIVEFINYFWGLADKKNFVVFHLYQPLEYLILAILYSKLILSKRVRKVILASIPLFFLLCALLTFTIQPITENNDYAFDVEGIMLIIITSLYLLQIANDERADAITKDSFFWISLGLLTFYAGTFFQMGFHNFLSQRNPALSKKLYYINYFLNYLMYSLFTVGIYAKR